MAPAKIATASQIAPRDAAKGGESLAGGGATHGAGFGMASISRVGRWLQALSHPKGASPFLAR
jgi:hypothetical protein